MLRAVLLQCIRLSFVMKTFVLQASFAASESRTARESGHPHRIPFACLSRQQRQAPYYKLENPSHCLT